MKKRKLLKRIEFLQKVIKEQDEDINILLCDDKFKKHVVRIRHDMKYTLFDLIMCGDRHSKGNGIMSYLHKEEKP